MMVSLPEKPIAELVREANARVDEENARYLLGPLGGFPPAEVDREIARIKSVIRGKETQ
ncbi:hypothetical protein LCGC14_0589570 [marine sediment metagenome]|uniref:Uncharacterized protein n=1 Tax=marine sediment metagenome TaxID=412755 RepID=A0A0F9UM73_9ZZZZ